MPPRAGLPSRPLRRLRLLRGIETLKIKNVEAEKFATAVTELVKVCDMGLDKERSAWRDYVSHFILRLAFCRTDDLRRWLLQYECALFKHRTEGVSPDELRMFMDREGIQFELVGSAEMKELEAQLSALEESTKDRRYCKYARLGPPHTAIY